MKKLTRIKKLAIDTETTGLYAYLNDHLFSIIITSEFDNYYFNFNKEPAQFISKYCELTPKKTSVGFKKSGKIHTNILKLPIPKENILDRSLIKELQVIIDSTETIFFHNAKFDMHMLGIEGLVYPEYLRIFCTENGARIARNDLPTYKLSYVSKVAGVEQKSDLVTAYIKEHKCHDLSNIRNKYYNKVYFPIIVEYGLQDGRTTYQLGIFLENKIAKKDEELNAEVKLKHVLDNEIKLTNVLYKMESKGILLDVDYTKKALEHEIKTYTKAANDFGVMTGVEFSDGELTLKPAFEALGLEYGLTKGGKPSFADSVLEGLEHPLAKMIQDYRQSYKKAHTYFENYLNLADKNNYIHCNFRQGGTLHGRMSCSDPNLQNVNKEKIDKVLYPVRRCFIPPEDYFFLMIDYDQMEYRLMLDYANERGVIDMILDGVDVHTATKEQMGIKDTKNMTARDVAKRINFLLLYGGGTAKLAINLFNLTLDEDLLKEIWTYIWKDKLNPYEIATRCNIEDNVAEDAYTKLNETNELKQLYFTKLPRVKKFIKEVQDAAKTRGYVYNWFGRRCYFRQGHEYKAPNHLIAGGCADIVKLAMVKMDKILSNNDSYIALQIHDENVFALKYGEEHLIPVLAKTMQDVYKSKHLPLTVGVEYSATSWADKLPYTL